LPTLLPAVLLSALLVALLSGVDVTTVLLLHPPGRPSLPLAIFTVMANAPEHMVAVLCLLYVGGATVALVGIWSLASRALKA
jgi:ABC-type spermidine/putrescine transport system permease subunit II